MKIKILILLTFLTTLHSFSQSNSFILAGDTVGDSGCPVIYHDIPDTSFASGYQDDIPYYIDLNGDGSDDFYFLSYSYGGLGGGSSSSRIYPINNNNSVLINSSAFSLTQNGYVDTLNINDTINNDKLWRHYYCFLVTHSVIYGDTSFTNGSWYNISNKYVGLKMIHNNNTIFGWCKVSIQNFNHITIHGFAYKNCYAGNESVDLNYLEVSPNPANTYLNIAFKDNAFPADINLFNTQGNLILSEKLTGTESNLDVSDIPQGIYILKFVSKKGVSTEKVIIQH